MRDERLRLSIAESKSSRVLNMVSLMNDESSLRPLDLDLYAICGCPCTR